MQQQSQVRSLGLFGATGIGVGAIVGGGVLALAGVAFASTGPGAVVAFALNGVIALLTVLSFAELSTAFPESGGTYTFARKVLTVHAAFAVGWVVWFASVVAAVLYALGFAAYAVVALQHLAPSLGVALPWLGQTWLIVALALGATAFYTIGLVRRNTGGGQGETIGKVLLFSVLIVGGIWALGREGVSLQAALLPLFPAGAGGLFQAMGYTFIAMQGYDLIAAVAGEVRDPQRNLPRAMLGSLAIAVAIYLPLLLIIAIVGVPQGQTLVDMATQHPETIVAVAARNYLGAFGFWLVVLAALLSMLSALYANLLAASRMAMAMARNRALPHALGALHPRRGTPVIAIAVVAGFVAILVVLIPDVSAAGAAASLIFLISFALVHGIAILARLRDEERPGVFRTPWFPLIPVAGAVTCIALAVFQGIAVPVAGIIVTVWLLLGGGLFLFLFGPRARIVDAAAEAADPGLVRLRGRSPLVLVPIANPANAAAMVGVANSLAPVGVGRVLLLSVVPSPGTWQHGQTPPALRDAQDVLRESLTASFAAGLQPEALISVAPVPWTEIGRVARIHRCASLLLGLSDLGETTVENHLERLMSTVDCHVAILRAPPGWSLANVRRVLVPVGGRGSHDELRARFLGSLLRTDSRQITFLRILPADTDARAEKRAIADLRRVVRDKAPGADFEVVLGDDAVEEIAVRAAHSDLLVLGLQRLSRRRKVFGEFALRVARRVDAPVVMISQEG